MGDIGRFQYFIFEVGATSGAKLTHFTCIKTRNECCVEFGLAARLFSHVLK